MDINEEIQEIEEEQHISPIIQIFERLTFERGHEVHDQVASMAEVFSLSNVNVCCFRLQLNQRMISFCLFLGNIRYVGYIH